MEYAYRLNKMKQYITKEDVLSLSEEAQEKLRKWWKPQKGEIFIYLYAGSEWVEAVNTQDDWDFINDNKMANGLTREKVLPLLSIGRMLEFLDNHSHECDSLWKEVKETLK